MPHVSSSFVCSHVYGAFYSKFFAAFGMSHLTELQIGVEFLEENEGMGNSTNLCIQMNQNTFHCWSNTTEWKIESETVYTGNGFVTKSINR